MTLYDLIQADEMEQTEELSGAASLQEQRTKENIATQVLHVLLAHLMVISMLPVFL
jgi:hypothetical protein